jgi:hypothetical protein
VSPSLLYRVASVLLVLFGLGHQLGFRRVDPRWGVDSAIGALKATQFQVQGMTRTYWDFFSGFGFFVTVLLFFSAILAFHLAGLSKESLRSLSLVTWAFAVSFGVIALLTWRYFFIAPLIFSSLVALCLLMAAWSAARA